MSFKAFIQILILILIILIISTVYYKYFYTNKEIVEEINSLQIDNSDQIKNLEQKISELELKNIELNDKIQNSQNNLKIKSKDQKTLIIKNEDVVKKNEIRIDKKINVDNKTIKENKKEVNTEKEIKNLVKDVEYTSIDQKGNKFYLLANSAKSNKNNIDILDLNNVRGKILSDTRETIYILSDFAQYNSVNLNSKFYENVIINYQDKEIKCSNFDINMETNKAIAYNNVVITDPKSTMKAGIVEFDLKTKNININPESIKEEIKVITN
tara:strand:+ start:34 stop:840 length:807 start_codon:yes stop_codon:yes gene_type:complete